MGIFTTRCRLFFATLWAVLLVRASDARSGNGWTTASAGKASGNEAAPHLPQISRRAEGVESFKVMDVLARAGELERLGRSICHLEVGQPETGAPQQVREAASAALSQQRIGYTDALGILPLRQRIARHYAEKYGVQVSPDRVVVTTGSSGAFLLAFLAAFDAGDRVAVASSSYPCYRNILGAVGCEVVTVPINSEYKVTAAELRKFLDEEGVAGGKPVNGIILSSPSNPTGAMLTPEEVGELAQLCRERGVLFISDEIYHGITFGKPDQTALAYGDDSLVINSFSKYYSMTGWRLGWMIVPAEMVAAVNRLAQNVYINAPTLSQLAGVKAFHCREELERHVQKYAKNRRILLESLSEMGFTSTAPSDGAFYVYVDVSDKVADSKKFASDLLETAGVAITPGDDFEDPASGLGRQRVRFSFCGSTSDMEEAMRRIRHWWQGYADKLS